LTKSAILQAFSMPSPTEEHIAYERISRTSILTDKDLQDIAALYTTINTNPTDPSAEAFCCQATPAGIKKMIEHMGEQQFLIVSRAGQNIAGLLSGFVEMTGYEKGNVAHVTTWIVDHEHNKRERDISIGLILFYGEHIIDKYNCYMAEMTATPGAARLLKRLGGVKQVGLAVIYSLRVNFALQKARSLSPERRRLARRLGKDEKLAP
jgi:hypothetical protein